MAQIISFILAHKELEAGIIIAILDLVFALNAKAASNGILHFVYLKAKSLLGK